MKTWGYILIGPGRPSQTKQRGMLAALGVTITGKFPPIWSDKIEGGREQLSGINGKGLLKDRDKLAEEVAMRGDRVIVAAPWCLGISPRDAKGFIESVLAKGASLVVGEEWHMKPGDDVEPLVEAVRRAQNTANVTAYRKRKTSS